MTYCFKGKEKVIERLEKENLGSKTNFRLKDWGFTKILGCPIPMIKLKMGQ